jgi:NADPH-dependent curcumin reductase CurA
MTVNRQILLHELPKGKLTPANFRLAETDIPSPNAGEVLVRTRYVAMDAAMRAWMMGATYRAGLTAGQLMSGTGLAEVVDSRDPAFKPGDLVFTETGWQDYAVVPARGLAKLGHADPITHLISVYGTAGLTAYFGLLEIGQPKEGETIVVSAAAGGVGSIVGQIAKLKGCRAVGIAGGAEKCALLTDKLGFDAAIDYKAAPSNPMHIYTSLQKNAPGGIDVYFDNVGGPIMDNCLFSMREHGRIVCCGAVSVYDGGEPYGMRGVPGFMVSRRLNMRGFIVSDFYTAGRREAAVDELKGWVASGKIKVPEDIVDGLENLPNALIGLLAGDNIGKRLVKVA